MLNKEPIGLVLSGGGVRGMAHIGVIKVMEELGISADYVSGTSAGALVGVFYAAGYSADEMLDFFINTPVFKLQNYAYKKPGLVDLEKLIPAFLKYFPDNKFETLKKKFFVTATDLLRPQGVIFSEGKLIERVLASSAIPLVFSPITMDGSLFADGGISNNFPIEPIQSHCKKIIGIHVNPILEMKENHLKSSLSVLERAYHIGLALPSYPKFKQCDIFIGPHDLSQFKGLDMKHIQDIYQIGYDTAKGMIPQFEQLKKEIDLLGKVE